MIQLQSRKNPFIGDADYETRAWRLDDEATIVTKSMKAERRQSSNIGGERAIRIVDTRSNPELALK